MSPIFRGPIYRALYIALYLGSLYIILGKMASWNFQTIYDAIRITHGNDHISSDIWAHISRAPRYGCLMYRASTYGPI